MNLILTSSVSPHISDFAHLLVCHCVPELAIISSCVFYSSLFVAMWVFSDISDFAHLLVCHWCARASNHFAPGLSKSSALRLLCLAELVALPCSTTAFSWGPARKGKSMRTVHLVFFSYYTFLHPCDVRSIFVQYRLNQTSLNLD